MSEILTIGHMTFEPRDGRYFVNDSRGGSHLSNRCEIELLSEIQQLIASREADKAEIAKLGDDLRLERYRCGVACLDRDNAIARAEKAEARIAELEAALSDLKVKQADSLVNDSGLNTKDGGAMRSVTFLNPAPYASMPLVSQVEPVKINMHERYLVDPLPKAIALNYQFVDANKKVDADHVPDAGEMVNAEDEAVRRDVQLVESILRDVCECEPDDADHPETICILRGTLMLILDRNLGIDRAAITAAKEGK